MCERSKSRTFAVVILSFFEGNKTLFSAKNELDKVVIVGRSNNAEAWRQSFQPLKENGGLGAEHRR